MAWPSRAGLPQSVEKCFCHLEVGRVEPFCKSVVDRPEERLTLGGSTPIVQQSGEAGGCAQLEGQGALPARGIKRLPEAILGGAYDPLSGLQQKELTLHAQQLSEQPAFFIAPGAFDCLLRFGEAVRDLPGTTKALRHFTTEHEVVHRKEPLASFIEAGAQHSQSAGHIAALGQK